MNKELLEVTKAGIDRFLAESSPIWDRNTYAKVTRKFGLEPEDVGSIEVISELNRLNVVRLVGKEECWFFITAHYLSESLPNSFKEVGVKYLLDSLSKLGLEKLA